MSHVIPALWYVSGSFMWSCSTLFISIASVRFLGAETAGIISFHFAMAILFTAIGKFGTRNFQISDTREEFSPDEYRMQRIFTVTWMLFLSIYFVFGTIKWNDEWFLPVLYIYFIKGIDAYADVIEGELQRSQKLGTSGQVAFFRIGGYTTLYIIVIYLTRNLKIAMSAALMYSLIITCVHYMKYVDMFLIPAFRWSNVFRITKGCLPLCLSEFLLLMISNIPKYRINQVMDAEYQTYFSCISMPSQFIPMCTQFVFGASLAFLSIYFERHEVKNIKKVICRDFASAGIITAIALICGFFLGIPVLNLLYGLSLEEYKGALLLILIGGGFQAGLIVSNGILTIVRKQNYTFYSYLIAILCMVLAASFIHTVTIWSSAWLYSIGMAVAFFISCICACKELRALRTEDNHIEGDF